MADNTQISWTDSTFNPWWGCTKIAPGCDNCYAATLDNRVGGNHWGAGSAPRIMSENNWRKPMKWAHKHFYRCHECDWRGDNPILDEVYNTEVCPSCDSQLVATTKRRVFCGSMCDVFDNNAPDGQRERLWQLIRETPMLTWQLLTKRAPNIEKYLPDDWGDGYDNVWLGVTVEDRKHGLPRADILSVIPAKVRFLSCEPLLESLGEYDFFAFDWVIVGGESGPHARPMHQYWVMEIKQQCQIDKVPFFFKQWGGNRKDKGGCLLDGEEVKQWPAEAR